MSFVLKIQYFHNSYLVSTYISVMRWYLPPKNFLKKNNFKKLHVGKFHHFILSILNGFTKQNIATSGLGLKGDSNYHPPSTVNYQHLSESTECTQGGGSIPPLPGGAQQHHNEGLGSGMGACDLGLKIKPSGWSQMFHTPTTVSFLALPGSTGSTQQWGRVCKSTRWRWGQT